MADIILNDPNGLLGGGGISEENVAVVTLSPGSDGGVPLYFLSVSEDLKSLEYVTLEDWGNEIRVYFDGIQALVAFANGEINIDRSENVSLASPSSIQNAGVLAVSAKTAKIASV